MKKILKFYSISLLAFFFFNFLGNLNCFATACPNTVSCCPCVGGVCSGGLTCVDGQCQDPNQVTYCPLSEHTEIKDLVDKISNEILYLALIIAPLFILLGGFYMITSTGDPKRSTQGKSIITWALIGLAVILTAKAFISVITSVIK